MDLRAEVTFTNFDTTDVTKYVNKFSSHKGINLKSVSKRNVKFRSGSINDFTKRVNTKFFPTKTYVIK